MKRLTRRPLYVCELCRFTVEHRYRQSVLIESLSSPALLHSSWQTQLPKWSDKKRPLRQLNVDGTRWSSTVTSPRPEREAQRKLRGVREKLHGLGLFNSTTVGIVAEQDALKALSYLGNVAKSLLGIMEADGENESTPASALLSLEEEAQQEQQPTSEAAVVQESPLPSHQESRTAATISDLARGVLTHPSLFITPKILEAYVSLQTQLGHPEILPEAFTLYATKPTPKPKLQPTEYPIPNPNTPASAVPLPLANAALGAAIAKKDLPLCLAIIDTTVCRPAYLRSKIIRKALPPFTAFALAPVAVYSVASQLAVFQDTMDNAMATNVAFAGILSYVAFTATIGIVAVTTANDQMDRVTWATGMPLRERWLREEERAMLDRVAQAWGFKDKRRRGEEEGKEWEELREWIGRRGMILDRVSLMEGME